MTKVVANRGPAIVGVVCDRRIEDGVALDTLRVRYLEALHSGAGVVSLAIPTGLPVHDLKASLSVLNGVLLTGAASNVAPSFYGGITAPAHTLDTKRDETSFSIIAAALSLGVPLLGICRGLQELNVALGGTLEQNISKGDDRLLHIEDLTLPRDAQYTLRHEIIPDGNGCIAQCIRQIQQTPVLVNSLHRQGIACLADDLAVDARCMDGVIEAVSVKNARAFAAAVQWHPEWHYDKDALSREIFRAFGDACRHHLEKVR
ncbi:gamma-glutamyl-gamma-aminobutyrate hydrolase family protein [Mesorhizobium carmichaelinearum]|uniref:gamma-glutamyl-gamma-aminobutyrate hydrolase family protein n=1 Tax=Mesorhizobium carmichaelinearum TaxID=1208188 RepID=UPI000BA2CE5D|nr:gamma-glutamyl-gamma-aminobutyrate hydrolase family protein [Mesorhizobium carmichaelinearum]